MIDHESILPVNRCFPSSALLPHGTDPSITTLSLPLQCVPGFGEAATRVFWWCHDGQEAISPSGLSKINEKEVQMVVGLLFLSATRTDQAIFYHCPCHLSRTDAQASSRAPNSEAPADVTTVDRFQGDENDIIILSLVRSNHKTVGFLDKENRFCVSVSRARHVLFILDMLIFSCLSS